MPRITSRERSLLVCAIRYYNYGCLWAPNIRLLGEKTAAGSGNLFPEVLHYLYIYILFIFFLFKMNDGYNSRFIVLKL